MLFVGPVSEHPGCAGINWPSATVATVTESEENVVIEDDPKYH